MLNQSQKGEFFERIHKNAKSRENGSVDQFESQLGSSNNSEPISILESSELTLFGFSRTEEKNLYQKKACSKPDSILKNLEIDLSVSKNKLNSVFKQKKDLTQTSIDKDYKNLNISQQRNLNSLNFSFNPSCAINSTRSNTIKSLPNKQSDSIGNCNLFKTRLSNQFLLTKDRFKEMSRNTNSVENVSSYINTHIPDRKSLNQFPNQLDYTFSPLIGNRKSDNVEVNADETQKPFETISVNNLHDFNTSKGQFLPSFKNTGEEKKNSVNFNISLKQTNLVKSNKLNFTFKQNNSTSLDHNPTHLGNAGNYFKTKSLELVEEIKEEDNQNSVLTTNFNIF